ncbi:MAG: extracellular solute-binding protein [Eubacteriales bacterium]|nr:extracellular solute-binding protein [Eubacteriales bacterium]
MKKRMRKILAAILGGATLTSSLFSYGVSAAEVEVTQTKEMEYPALEKAKESGEKIKLTFWHNASSPAVAQYEPHVKSMEDFANDYPNIEIEADTLSETEYRYVLQSRLASGEYADCFIYWGTGGCFDYARNGYFLNLDDYVTDDYFEEILPNCRSAAYCDDSIYMIPYSNSCSGLVVNKALFDEYGFEVPTTYDELLQNVKEWVELGIVPCYIGGSENWTTMGLWDTLGMREVGAATADAAIKGDTSWNQEGFIEAARKVQELVEAGFFQEGFMSMTANECNTIFMEGNVPYNYTGSWFAGIFSDMEDVRAVPWPDHETGQDATEVFGGPSSGVFINANTEYPEIATEFAMYYATHMSKYSIQLNKMPNTYKMDFDPAELNPVLSDFINLFENAGANCSYRDHMLGESRTAMYVEPIQKLFMKEITPEEFIEDLDNLDIYDVY